MTPPIAIDPIDTKVGSAPESGVARLTLIEWDFWGRTMAFRRVKIVDSGMIGTRRRKDAALPRCRWVKRRLCDAFEKPATINQSHSAEHP